MRIEQADTGDVIEARPRPGGLFIVEVDEQFGGVGEITLNRAEARQLYDALGEYLKGE